MHFLNFKQRQTENCLLCVVASSAQMVSFSFCTGCTIFSDNFIWTSLSTLMHLFDAPFLLLYRAPLWGVCTLYSAPPRGRSFIHPSLCPFRSLSSLCATEHTPRLRANIKKAQAPSSAGRTICASPPLPPPPSSAAAAWPIHPLLHKPNNCCAKEHQELCASPSLAAVYYVAARAQQNP